LKQAHWDLVIVDEAHRMSSTSERKTERYKLGELLRHSTDHLLLLTATPHRDEPVNFTMFLQLLDEDVVAGRRQRQRATGGSRRRSLGRSLASPATARTASRGSSSAGRNCHPA
jgi:hypothetical protein